MAPAADDHEQEVAPSGKKSTFRLVRDWLTSSTAGGPLLLYANQFPNVGATLLRVVQFPNVGTTNINFLINAEQKIVLW